MNNEERQESDSGRERRHECADRKSLKQRGQDAAVACLQRQCLVIAARDWRCPAGRIDIIAWDGLEIVLIEVVTCTAASIETDDRPVSAAKKKRLTGIARAWLAESQLDSQPVRFDVITLLVLAEDRVLLRHLRGALTITA